MIFHIISKVVIGGLNYLVVKLFLDMTLHKHAQGSQKKSALLTFSNFVSLVLLGLPLFWQELRQLRATGEKNPYNLSANIALWLPGVLECLAVFMSMKGNEVLPASILVFMKATRVFWSALLTLFYLRRPVYKFMWLGVVLAAAGLLPIMLIAGPKKEAKALANGKTGENATGAEMFVAGCMVALCELARAIRVILEEQQMKVHGRSPMFVQWVEGYIGLIVSTLLLVFVHFAVPDNNKFHEDLGNSMDAIVGQAEPELEYAKCAVFLFIWHTVLVGLVNYSSNVVTHRLSSVHNAIFSEARIVVVWIPEFLLGKKFGYAFKPLYLLEIIGFAMIVLSAFVYSGKYKIPGTDFLYPKDHPLVSGNAPAVAKPGSPSTSSERLSDVAGKL